MSSLIFGLALGFFAIVLLVVVESGVCYQLKHRISTACSDKEQNLEQFMGLSMVMQFLDLPFENHMKLH